MKIWKGYPFALGATRMRTELAFKFQNLSCRKQSDYRPFLDLHLAVGVGTDEDGKAKHDPNVDPTVDLRVQAWLPCSRFL